LTRGRVLSVTTKLAVEPDAILWPDGFPPIEQPLQKVQQAVEVGILDAGCQGHPPMLLHLGNLGGIVGTRSRLDCPSLGLRCRRLTQHRAIACGEPVARQPMSFV